jgi:uncharacterized protein YjdB
MKRCAIALILISSLLSLAAVGFNGCGKGTVMTSITVTPPDPFFVKGSTVQLHVEAYFTGGMVLAAWTQVTWKSLNPAVATVSATGWVTGNAPGHAVITATDIVHPSFTSSVTVNVTETPLESIDVAPANIIISLGTTTQFTATGTLADGTPLPNLGSSVNWSSSHTGVAIISNSTGSGGFVTAVAAGTTLIVATDPVTNISGLTTLTVTP